MSSTTLCNCISAKQYSSRCAHVSDKCHCCVVAQAFSCQNAVPLRGRSGLLSSHGLPDDDTASRIRKNWEVSSSAAEVFAAKVSGMALCPVMLVLVVGL